MTVSTYCDVERIEEQWQRSELREWLSRTTGPQDGMTSKQTNVSWLSLTVPSKCPPPKPPLLFTHKSELTTKTHEVPRDLNTPNRNPLCMPYSCRSCDYSRRLFLLSRDTLGIPRQDTSRLTTGLQRLMTTSTIRSDFRKRRLQVLANLQLA